MEIDEKHIKQLVSTRYLYQLAGDQAAIERNPAIIASISLLQDALETFLITSADFLNANVNPRSDFSGYLDKINEKLPENVELPFRTRLIQINKVRVNSKHHGIRPDHTELLGYLGICRDFFSQAATAVFNVDFWSLSLVETLNDGATKEILKECESALVGEEYKDVLILARRAFFLEFEKPYDIKRYENVEEPSDNFLFHFGCCAPSYTRNAKYIDEHVKCPFDYIVLDHGRIDAELTKMQIDNGTWWNIWRLTPEVYYYETSNDWIEKNTLDIFESDGLGQRATYVFESTVDIIRKKEAFQRSLRWVRGKTRFSINPKPGAPIYEKACRNSKIVRTIPEELKSATTMYSSPGLNSTGVFWYVIDSIELNGERVFVSGFLDQEDCIWN